MEGESYTFRADILLQAGAEIDITSSPLVDQRVALAVEACACALLAATQRLERLNDLIYNITIPPPERGEKEA